MEDKKQSTQNPWDAVGSVAMVSSFVPRRCGIATFTRDLTDAVANRAADVNVLSVAMNDRPEGYRYPQRVWFEINQNRLPEYRLAADFLNMSLPGWQNPYSFNVADIAIFAGAIGLVLMPQQKPEPKTPFRKPRSKPQAGDNPRDGDEKSR